MQIQTPDVTAKVRHLNDFFRKNFFGGLVVCTQGVSGLDEDSRRRLMREIQNFDDFDEDNDPHAEHDFGSIEMNGGKFFFKIDYYDQSMEMGSPDPADPKVTKRVLTIMRQDEW